MNGKNKRWHISVVGTWKSDVVGVGLVVAAGQREGKAKVKCCLLGGGLYTHKAAGGHHICNSLVFISPHYKREKGRLVVCCLCLHFSSSFGSFL